MSCLLIVSWVIEVEYTLTAIPQLRKKRETKKNFDILVIVFRRQCSKQEKKTQNPLLFIEKGVQFLSFDDT